MSQQSLFADLGVTWLGVPMDEANAALVAWGHQMGTMRRVDYGEQSAQGLRHNGRLVALTITDGLVAETVGGAPWLNRGNCVELVRLCAERPGLCRVALRLWREFTWPEYRRTFAVSYQDKNLHTGDTYRFDGWERVGESRSGPDTRSGAVGRDKAVWQWPPKVRA